MAPGLRVLLREHVQHIRVGGVELVQLEQLLESRHGQAFFRTRAFFAALFFAVFFAAGFFFASEQNRRQMSSVAQIAPGLARARP